MSSATILVLLGLLRHAMLAGDAFHPLALSDRGYENISFLNQARGSIRTTYKFESNVHSANRCAAFYDVAFTLDDNQINGLANVGIAKVTSAMQLAQSADWDRGPYANAIFLRRTLDRADRGMQWVGVSATLLSAGSFGPSDGPPRTFVRGAADQNCYFHVYAQYFLKFEVPKFLHFVILDATPRCGPGIMRPIGYPAKDLDRAALQTWIDGFGIESDYQRSMDGLIDQLQSTDDEIRAVRRTAPYKDAVKHCRQLLGEPSE